jgi:hypothetical protein
MWGEYDKRVRRGSFAASREFPHAAARRLGELELIWTARLGNREGAVRRDAGEHETRSSRDRPIKSHVFLHAQAHQLEAAATTE